MKNIVNRALVAKKKQFQSKSVPRGTRTIWRYLGALFLLFTFAIGNVWADLTAHTPGVYEKTVAKGGYGCTLTTVASGTNAGTFEVYYFSAQSKYSENTTVYNGGTKQQYRLMCTDSDSEYQLINTNGTSAFTASCDWIEMAYTTTGFSKSDYTFGTNKFNEFFEITPNGGNTGITKTCYIKPKEGDVMTLKVSGYVEFAILGNDNGSSKYMTITVDGGTPTSWKSNTLSRRAVSLTTGEHTIVVACVGNSANAFYGFSLKLPSCDATAPGNISKGALSAGFLTLQVADDPKTGDEFYWQTSATGTTKNKTGENINFGKTYQVSAAGTYYIRSYNVADDCWSDAKSFEVKAADLVANYTVIYKDGTTELGSETVEVGKHPTGSEIADPTKDCYTFAGWSPALSSVSGTDGATVYVNATWTGNYFTTSVDFENGGTSAVSGIASKNIVASNAGSYDAGKESENWAYKGWKIKSNGATVKVLVQANKKLTYKFGYLAATAHVNITNDNITREVTGASKEEGNPLKYTTYSHIKDYDAVYTFTTGSDDAAVIKALSVEAVYTAYFEDEMGVVTTTVVGNVTEVTLPTPSVTTKSGKNFIGWKANKAVTVDDVVVDANTLIAAGKIAVLSDNTTFTTQWVAPANFDVKFFQGYGDPDVQIGDKQTISTGKFAVAPADPERAGFVFLGWSYDATEAHIVDVAAYGITAATDFTAMWKAVWTVTFDGAGAVNVENGETVASPDSPTQAGKIFQGWYNGESKYDFSAAVTGNLALISKWADADANHFYYNYKDDFHFDGVVYKTPEGKTTNPEADEATLNLTTPYILFSGAEGIEEIKVTNGIYDYKKAADTKHVTSYIKINTGGSSKIEFTIAAGYTAVLKMKMGGYSSDPTITLQKGDDVVAATSGEPGGKKASVENNFNEIVYDLEAGTYTMTTATKTLYISHIDLEAEALPAYTVTYKAGEGTGDDVVDADATEVADVPGTFTAPSGKVFNGWKDSENADVEVGAIVSADMTLTAQWINQYAVTFNMNGHGAAIATQNILAGGKATKPVDPAAMGWDFGGWFTDAECTAGNEFDFNTTITAATPLFAKWTAFTGCVELWPATSGEALTVGATVDLQTGSTGGSITVANLNETGSISYHANGLSFSKGGKDSVRVTLNSELQNGSVIKVRLMANGGTNSSGRGLNLLNAAKAKKALLGWQANEEVVAGNVGEYSYTVEDGDGFAGTNFFILQRQNSVILQSVKVSNCGAAIVYHDLTSAVDPTGQGTVTLSASSVREGYTATATYSEIDEAYEFDEWQISGTGATIDDASANPVTVTMGTADAVITLKLKTATPKHTVTYDVMDHGVAPANEDVKEGAKVTEPTAPTAVGWAFDGWYKENTLENKWDFDVDVMGTSNITLYAKWEDETSAIKLFDGEGNLNTTNFVSAPKNADPIEIASVEYPCLAQFAANRTSLGGAVPADFVQYNATTDATKMKITLYNTNSGAKKALLYMVEEGDTEFTPVEIEVPGQEIFTTSYYTFNSTKNRSFYLCAKDRSNIRVLQVTVLDNGTAIKQAGQAGYSLNFNKGRMYVSTSAATSFEGATINVSSEYKVANNSSLATNSYISFTTTVDKTVLKVTRSGGNYYVSQDTENKGTSYNKNEEIVLSPAGTWYLGSVSSGSAASFTKIEFLAPKCAEPAFNSLTNSDICQGDSYVALNGTATVADAGTPIYQWYNADGDVVIEGATAAEYTPTADGSYYVIATNQLAGYTDNVKKSATVTVTTYASAAITTAPEDQRVDAGENATLTVAASGKAPLTYQWYTCDENGNNAVVIEGAEAATYQVEVTAGMNQYYKVVVSSGCGSAEAVALVEEWHEVTPANVTGSRTWDWAAESMGEIATESGSVEYLMANVSSQVPNTEAFRSDMLYITANYANRGTSNKFFQGWQIRFYTEVPGRVSMNCRAIHGTMSITVNGTVIDDAKGSDMGTATTPFFVPTGWVTIVFDNQSSGYEGEAARVQKITFDANPDYTRNVSSNYGTLCVENNVPAGQYLGATFYQIASRNEDYDYKIDFEEVLPNEELKAGEPYLFKSNTGKIELFYGEENAPTPIPVRGMIGNYAATSLEITEANKNTIYYFAQNKLYLCDNLVGGSLTLNDHRAYINLTQVPTYAEYEASKQQQQNPAPRRRVSLEMNGEKIATGCENLNVSDKPVKMIINGQLFILRGEKMYDAKGQLVK